MRQQPPRMMCGNCGKSCSRRSVKEGPTVNEPLQPELKFGQDGDDLVVSAMVEANNSPHVLWTRVHTFRGKVVPAGGRVEDAREEHRISLHYYVFQNRDL